MTNARVEQTYADRVAAREFLAQAQMFLADANAATLSAPSQAVLLHNATICACDGIHQAVGLRASPGDRSHVLRPQTALNEADGDTEEPFERSDAPLARGATRRPTRQGSSPSPAWQTHDRQRRSSSRWRAHSSQAAHAVDLNRK